MLFLVIVRGVRLSLLTVEANQAQSDNTFVYCGIEFEYARLFLFGAFLIFFNASSKHAYKIIYTTFFIPRALFFNIKRLDVILNIFHIMCV